MKATLKPNMIHQQHLFQGMGERLVHYPFILRIFCLFTEVSRLVREYMDLQHKKCAQTVYRNHDKLTESKRLHVSRIKIEHHLQILINRIFLISKNANPSAVEKSERGINEG